MVAAADTSTLVAFLQGASGPDVEAFDERLSVNDIVLPPVVLTEFLSEPALPAHHRALALQLPRIEIADGYWVRAGAMRASVLARKHRARLPDVLIAQSCIDVDAPLITRDSDFRHFAQHCGLKLL